MKPAPQPSDVPGETLRTPSSSLMGEEQSARAEGGAAERGVSEGTSEGFETSSRIVPLRLQRFLARAGVASRRRSEDLMTAGRVRVNGQVVTELGSKVDPAVDIVEVDGHVVHWEDGPTTIAFNKPAGVITTMAAQSDDPIVADFVPTEAHPGLYPIGRLDADTTGLLLFSTDGNLGNSLLHPSKHVAKTYVVGLSKTLGERQLNALREGVMLTRALEDGSLIEEGMTQPAQVKVLAGASAKTACAQLEQSRAAMQAKRSGERSGRIAQVLEITVHEGRYHQIKRMIEAVGAIVVALHRTTFGPITLGNLKTGSWRVLDDDEVALLHSCV